MMSYKSMNNQVLVGRFKSAVEEYGGGEASSTGSRLLSFGDPRIMLCATVASTCVGAFEAARRCRTFNWSFERIVVARELSARGGRGAGADGSREMVLGLADGGGS